jgi:hypothetical protein
MGLLNMSLGEYRPIDVVAYSITFALVLFIMNPQFTYSFTVISMVPIIFDYVQMYYKNFVAQSLEMHIYHVAVILCMFSVVWRCIAKTLAQS